MSGIKLEVNVHIITAALTSLQNLKSCIERAGIGIEEIVLNQIATAQAVLTHDERELGVGQIDIGAGTTEVAIFERGSLWYTSTIPIGGDNFTNDIAVGLRTPIPEAERIKKKFGCIAGPPVEEQETIEVPSVGKGRKPRVLSRQLLADIIQPRAEEIFRLVDSDIKRMGYDKSLNSGIVLTGGTALLEGLEEVAEEIFDLPVRRGDPGRRRRPRRPRLDPRLRHGRGARPLRLSHLAGPGSCQGPQKRRSRQVQETGSRKDKEDIMSEDPSRLKFHLVEDHLGAKIKVIGLGGGGGNAVNRMIEHGVQGVEFIAVNTDLQALNSNRARTKIQIGGQLTKGLGSGGRPEIGRQAAMEDTEKLLEILQGADMVFLTTGLGGGTGTGATPIIANIAAELDILVIAIVTLPFGFEGRVRSKQADEGLKELKSAVDTVIAIPNERLLQTVNLNTSVQDAFRLADDILRQAAQGISDLITKPGLINLDFADVKSVMKGMGMAFMGTGLATGENRALEAAEKAISSPAAHRHVDRRRARRPHQHHRRQDHDPPRGLQSVPAHPQPGRSRRQHHLRHGHRREHEGHGQGHGHRHGLRPARREGGRRRPKAAPEEEPARGLAAQDASALPRLPADAALPFRGPRRRGAGLGAVRGERQAMGHLRDAFVHPPDEAFDLEKNAP